MPASGRTLVIQPLPGVGDMVWHLNVLEAIALTAGPVTVLSKPKSASDTLLAGVGFVEGVLWLERNAGRHDGPLGLLRLARELRAEGFACAWVLHQSPYYAALAWLAGIPSRRGFGLGAQRPFLTDRRFLPPEARAWHPIERARELLRIQEVALAHDEPHYPVDAARGARMEGRFAERPKPWVGLGITSAGMPKRWPEERFAALADRIVERSGGTIFLVGAPWDADVASAVEGALGAARDRVERVLYKPLDEIGAFVSRLDWLVGNDSAVLNLAAATGVPCLGLFGASRPLSHSRHIHVTAAPGGILHEDREGMHRIEVSQVLDELDGLGWLAWHG